MKVLLDHQAAALSQPWSERVRLAAWAGLAAMSVYLLLFAGGYQSLTSFPLKVVIQAIGVAVIGTWSILALLRPAWRPRTPILVPLAVAVGAYLIAAGFSQRPRLSLEPAIAGVAYGLALLVLGQLLARPWFRSRAGVLLVTSVAFVAVGYVIQVTFEWVRWWQTVGSIALPPLRPAWAGLAFLTPNLVATYLLMAGPLGICVLYGQARSKWPAFLLLGVVLIAIFLAGSRAGWVTGLLIGGVFTLAWFGRSRRGVHPSALPSTRRIVALAVAAAVVVVVAGVALPAIAHRFAQGGADVRFDLWQSAMRVFLDHPLTGAGPGTWVQLKLFETPADVQNRVFSNAHNGYLQTAAEIGVVGIAGLVVLAAAVARRFRLARESEDPALRLDAVAATGGLVGFGGMAMFDSLSNVPVPPLVALGIVAWIDAGVTFREGPELRREEPLLSAAARVIPAAALIGLLLTIPLLVRVDAAWWNFEQGNAAAEVGGWDTALGFYDAALTADPDLVIYSIQAASARAHVGDTQGAARLLSDAVDEDGLAINLIGLAALELELRREPEAMAHAELAVERGFGESTVALNAGLIAEAVGDERAARRYFAKALAWNPALAGVTSFWADPNRVVQLDDTVTAALSTLSDDTSGAVMLLAYAGRIPEAQELLRDHPEISGRHLIEAVVDWRAGQPDRALARLQGVLAANPLDWEAAAWASRIARLSGDPGAGARFALWATIVQGDSAPSVIHEASAIPPIEDAATAGLPRSYPAAVYLRGRAPFMPMPQLTLIGAR